MRGGQPRAGPRDEGVALDDAEHARLLVDDHPAPRVMSAADAAWRASLQAVSIGDLAAAVERTSGPDALPDIGAWLNSAAAAG